MSVGELLDGAIHVRHTGGASLPRAVTTELTRDRDAFTTELTARLRTLVPGLWATGWQPVEAVRHVRRRTSATATRLFVAAVAADAATQDPARVDPRWAAQLAALGVAPAPGPARPAGTRGPWVHEWFADGSAADPAGEAVDLLVVLMTMPPIETLLPPPGADPSRGPEPPGSAPRSERVGASAAGAVLDPVLEKVRALLAKAESTTFEAEAEAFTAKAQELIARHAIDAALLAERGASQDRPVSIRLGVDDPYRDAKALLLQVVAEAGGCRAVFMGAVGMSTVIGHASDLAAVELLFTSLLLQAQTPWTRGSVTSRPTPSAVATTAPAGPAAASRPSTRTSAAIERGSSAEPGRSRSGVGGRGSVRA